jgi:hypothetical protein
MVGGNADAQRATVCRDTVLTADTAVFNALRVIAGNPKDTVTVHVVCGQAGTYVAALWGPARDTIKDYGARVVVLRRAASGVVSVVHVSPGMVDADLPRLRIHAVASRALVLVDLGSEGSWGLDTFEITPQTTSALGELQVGIPPSDEGDPDRSAIRSAVVSRVAEHWQVRFDTALVANPSQEPAKRRRIAAPSVFVNSNGSWTRTTR